MMLRVTQGPFIFHAPALGPGDGLGNGTLSPVSLSTGLPALEAHVPVGSALFAPVRGDESLPRVGFIQNLNDLPGAFSLLEKLGKPWKGMLDHLDRLQKERIERGEQGAGGEAFRVTVSKGGTYSLRSHYKDRRHELADGINLDPGQSVFGLVHELTHALPLDVLFPELAQLPYRELSDLGQAPTLEEAYHHILQSLYQDEAISCLAEILLYRDLLKAGYDVTKLETQKNLEEIKCGLKIYEKEGIVGYLRSEIYIGRNHRSSYSQHRAMALAAMVVCDPKVLTDSSSMNLLEEHGVSVSGDRSKLAEAVGRMANALETMSPDAISAATTAVAEVVASGMDVSIDPSRVMTVLTEALALRAGTQRKASDSFLGRRDEVRHQVEMVSAAISIRNGEALGEEFTVSPEDLRRLAVETGVQYHFPPEIYLPEDFSEKRGIMYYSHSIQIQSLSFLFRFQHCLTYSPLPIKLDKVFKPDERYSLVMMREKDLKYYIDLKNIRSHRSVKLALPSRDEGYINLHPDQAIVLGYSVDYYPSSFQFTPTRTHLLPSAPMTSWEENAHLGLEMVRRGLVPYSRDYLNPNEWGIHATFGSSPANQWICHRLALDWIVEAEKHGDTEYANQIRLSLKELFTGRTGSQFPEVCLLVEREQETFEWLLPLHRLQSVEERQKFLEECAQEYEHMIQLGRATHLAGTVAVELRAWTQDPTLRHQMKRLFELCIRQASTYDIHTESFRRSFGTLFEIIDQADLTHHEKEKLLLSLMKAGLERDYFAPVGAGSSARSSVRSLRAFEWAENQLLSNAMLGRVGHFTQVEAFLLEKVQPVLRELGATPLPEEYEERVKRIAGRIERHLLKFHPEIFNPDNIEKLSCVSRDPQYQVALADVFPARRVDVDPSLPVDQWNPVRVRRGLDDRPAAWELIKATLEGWLDQPVDTTQSEAVFDVYEAFSLREIDQDAKLSQHGDEIKNIWKMVQERKKEMSTEKVKTALTLYGAAVRILSRAEKKIVEETLQIPAIAWAFERVEPLLVAGSDFDEGSVRLWKSVLAAPTRADAVRKRELFVTVLADERFPLVVRRQAALGLVRGSRRGPVLEHLIEGYVSAKNENTEKDFYTLLIEYWQRVGELPPDDHALLFLQEEGLKNPSSFWQQFDRALSSGSANSLTTFDLELRAINHGSLSLRFIDEIERWSARPMAKQQGITFLSEFEAMFPTNEAKLGAQALVKPLIAAIRDQHLTRTEHLDLLKLKLPEVFMTLPAELRYASGRYFHHLPEDRRGALIQELQGVNSTGRAQVLSAFFRKAGGGLEKIGQVLSTLIDIIEDDAERAVYATLQDDVAPSPQAEVCRTIESDLGCPMNQIFQKWNPVPIAVGSMGEVYEATLIDGTEVLVKVLTPSKKNLILRTISILEKVAQDCRGAQTRLSGLGELADLIDDFREQLNKQIDYCVERRQTAQAEGLQVTKYVFDGPNGIEFTTPHVSVMKRALGRKISDFAGTEHSENARVTFGRDLFKMFEERYFHADPIPANALYDPELGQLTWIDWGVVFQISESDKADFLAFNGDFSHLSPPEEVVRQFLRAAKPDSCTDERRQKFIEDLRANPIPALDSNEGGLTRLKHLLKIANRHGIRLRQPIRNTLTWFFRGMNVMQGL